MGQARGGGPGDERRCGPDLGLGLEMGRENEALGFRGGGSCGGVVLTCDLEPVRPTSCQRRVTSGQAGDKGKSAIKASAAETLCPGCCPGNAS